MIPRNGIIKFMPKFHFSWRALVLFLSLLACGAGSTPDARAETIRSFDSAIHLQKDTTLDVVETIVWDYEGAQRHGIYRKIPVRYKRNQNSYSLQLKVLSVDNGQGRRWNYETSNNWGELEIKIGDAGVTLTGVQTYVIHYTVRRAVNFFKDANGQDAPKCIGTPSATCGIFPSRGLRPVFIRRPASPFPA